MQSSHQRTIDDLERKHQVIEQKITGHTKNKFMIFSEWGAVEVKFEFLWIAAGNERAEGKTRDWEARLDRKLHEETGTNSQLYTPTFLFQN